ncbi:MAG: hypothetical protein ACREBE_12630 [bacterium]
MATNDLTVIAAVRKRPGMFVGDVENGDGVLRMILEVVANACDQHFAGRCSMIDIEVAANDVSPVPPSSRSASATRAVFR